MKNSAGKGFLYGFFPYLALFDAIGNAAGIKDFNDLGEKTQNSLSSLWKGLTGETTAMATLEANQRNIENQNYWNTIQMQREDTAHQREVADLQAAGLNPWLSAGGGAQASSLNTTQVNAEDGSKILSATTGMALLAIIKLLAKKV